MGNCTISWQTTASRTCSCKEICHVPLVQGCKSCFSGSDHLPYHIRHPVWARGLQQLICIAFDANLTARGSNFPPPPPDQTGGIWMHSFQWKGFQRGRWELAAFTTETSRFTLCYWTTLRINIYIRSCQFVLIGSTGGFQTFLSILLRCFKN